MDHEHFLGHRKRLRERFLKNGLSSFADYEAVELLLTLAIPRKDTKLPAKIAIERFGSLRGVIDAPIDEVQKIAGIGEVGSVAPRIIKETANRYLQQQSKDQFSLANPEALYSYCRAVIGTLPPRCC